VKVPSDAIIPMEKLTAYLLVAREWDDHDGRVRFVTMKPWKEKKS
jgi:hypothetical protein